MWAGISTWAGIVRYSVDAFVCIRCGVVGYQGIGGVVFVVVVCGCWFGRVKRALLK